MNEDGYVRDGHQLPDESKIHDLIRQFFNELPLADSGLDREIVSANFIKNTLPQIEHRDKICLLWCSGDTAEPVAHALLFGRKIKKMLPVELETFHVDIAFTAADKRRQGIMQNLWQLLHKRLHSSGITHVELVILAKNDPARDFWTKMGMVKTREIYESIPRSNIMNKLNQ